MGTTKLQNSWPLLGLKILADFVHQVQLAVGLLYLPVMTPIQT